jgi:hypothetical protein
LQQGGTSSARSYGSCFWAPSPGLLQTKILAPVAIGFSTLLVRDLEILLRYALTVLGSAWLIDQCLKQLVHLWGDFGAVDLAHLNFLPAGTWKPKKWGKDWKRKLRHAFRHPDCII